MGNSIEVENWRERVVIELMRRGMTKEELAKSIDYHRDTVYSVLSGRKDFKNVQAAILRYLEII